MGQKSGSLLRASAISFMVLIALCGLAGNSEAQGQPFHPVGPETPMPDLPTLFDLGQLQLEVVSIQVAEEITSGQGEKKETMRPKEGFDLVVVTMQAVVESPCRVPVATNEFSAVWEHIKTRTIYGKTETSSSFYVFPSAALALNDTWTLTPAGRAVTVTYYFAEKGTALLRLAFLVPKAAQARFVIRYPVAAKVKEQKAGKGSPPDEPGEKTKK